MTINEAIKTGKAIEIEQDIYLLDDNREVKYDRYFGRRGAQAKWVDDQGWAYRNFFECYHKSTLYAIRVK